MNKIFAVLAFVTLASCGTVDYEGVPSSKIAGSVQELTSDFSKMRSFAGPPIRKQPENLTWYEVRLMSAVDSESGEVFHTIASRFRYTKRNWIYFEGVRLPGGEELESSRGNKDVDSCGSIGCTYVESLNSLIPEEYLLGDIRFQIYGKRGSYEITIPENYVEGYLSGVEELL